MKQAIGLAALLACAPVEQEFHHVQSSPVDIDGHALRTIDAVREHALGDTVQLSDYVADGIRIRTYGDANEQYIVESLARYDYPDGRTQFEETLQIIALSDSIDRVVHFRGPESYQGDTLSTYGPSVAFVARTAEGYIELDADMRTIRRVELLPQPGTHVPRIITRFEQPAEEASIQTISAVERVAYAMLNAVARSYDQPMVPAPRSEILLPEETGALEQALLTSVFRQP